MKYPSVLIATLADLYSQYDTPVDRLAQDQTRLANLTIDLNSKSAAGYDTATVLDALLYARKSGHLPRLRRKPR